MVMPQSFHYSKVENLICNVGELNAEIDKWAKEKPVEELTKLQRMIALEGVSRVVMRTPVDHGDARGGWQVTIDKPAEGGSGAFDPTGVLTVARGKLKIDKSTPYCIIYISSNVDHIEVLEYGLFQPSDPGPSHDPRPDRKGRVLVSGGYSRQAPRGMLSVTIEELKAIFN